MPIKVAEQREGEWDQPCQPEQTKEEQEHADEFTCDDFIQADGRGHEEFEGTQFFLFGEQPHGEDRQHDQEYEPKTAEQIAKHQIIEIELCLSLDLHELNGLHPCKHNIDVGEQADDQKKYRTDDIDD